MNIQIQKSILQSHFLVPTDKSISHRSLMFASMACNQQSVVRDLLWSGDVQCTFYILQKLGCDFRILREGETTIDLEINPKSFSLSMQDMSLYCGNSGTTMRLMMGLLSSCSFPFRLEGDLSLNKRPMKRVTAPLQSIGINYKCEGENNRPPVIYHPRRQLSEQLKHQDKDKISYFDDI